MKYYIHLFLVAVLLTGLGPVVYAQENAGSQDSTVVKKNETIHSPRKATLYSTVLPGLGQVYNKKYWKIPLIYGGFVGFGYAIKWNNHYYVKYKQAYSDITDDDPNTTSYANLPHGSYNLSSSSDLAEFADKIEQAENSARRYRDLNIIFTAAFYALNIIDASVDANFFDFDISDDLSVVWTPQTMCCLNQRFFCVNCYINF